MTETVPVGNYRTKLEAEFAATILAGADIPYVIQSMEGLLSGPLGPGATILVRAEQAAEARELLESLKTEPMGRGRAVRLTRCAGQTDADALQTRLEAAGIPFFVRTDAPLEIYVSREHAARARKLLRTGDAA